MNEPKWTPGPWWVEAETGDVVAKDGDWEICTFSRSDSQHEYDTNLICAAPDMYEACFAALQTHTLTESEDGLPTLREVEEKLRNALAKALGDEQ